MTDGRAVREGSPEPTPTWGSTLNIASGLTSAEYLPPATEAQIHRVLEMQPSPEAGVLPNGRSVREVTQGSSPVESFTSPTKGSQITETDSPHLQRKDTARLGTWDLPEEDEQAAIEVNIDPNGDDDVILAQVAGLIAREREAKRKRQEEESITSSHPSQTNGPAAAATSSHKLRNSTPPPARLKRSRRGQAAGDDVFITPASAIETPTSAIHQPVVEKAPRKVAEEELDVTKLAAPMAIVSDSYEEASCFAICQYVKASPLIPAFLKDEIARCVNRGSRTSQSQASTSDSDTQEDGFLKTKPFWIFELMRLEKNNTIVAGKSLKSHTKATDLTLVLHIFSETYTYGTQLVEQGPLIMSRNEVRSNPWFDGSGHPFSIVTDQDGFPSDGSVSSATRASAEQVVLLQSELEQVSKERDIAVADRNEAEKKLELARESHSSAQENYEFLRGEYGVASNTAAELVKTNRELTELVEALKSKLSDGMQAVRAVSQNQITTLEKRLSVTHSQLELLRQQNRLTDDAIREKAGKWDAYQAKEKIRLKELERRKDEVDAQRAAQYGLMQEEDRKRAADLLKAPHELMLEVDLAGQKESLPGENDEDELAMLRAEAEAATGSVVDINAPRSRRGRPSRAFQAAPMDIAFSEGIAPTETSNDIKDTAMNQDNAEIAIMDEAADILQGELEYQALTGAHNP